MADKRMFWLHTLSSTHVGAGRGVGYIDLPLHRDKVTNWPLIPGSALKGVWRDHFKSRDEKWVRTAFGRGGDETSNAGAIIATDARLVCLPIRSFYGTFAWCTSPLALQLLKRDLDAIGCSGPADIPSIGQNGTIHCPKGTALSATKETRIYLEDLDFVAKECDLAEKWAQYIGVQVFGKDSTWIPTFKERFAVLPDDFFSFLSQTGTQVDARVKIEDDTKTVVDGALWSEESLPAECIMAGFLICDRVYGQDGTTAEELLRTFTERELSLQIGGKATVGRGRVRCVFGGAQ